MFQRTIGIIVILAIVVIAGYDAWRYTQTHENLRDTTYQLARWSAENAATMSQAEVGRQLAAQGAAKGVTVYQYGLTENGVRVWTQAEVPDTIAAGIIANMISGKTFNEAAKAPFIIRDYREAGFQ